MRSLWVGSGEEGYQSRGVGRGNTDSGVVEGSTGVGRDRWRTNKGKPQKKTKREDKATP